MFAWSKLIALNSEGYFLSNTNRYFLGKDEDTKFTEKQKSMVAVSFLIIICSIIEIILAIAAIRSSNIDVQGPQESQVGARYGQLEAGQVRVHMPRQSSPTAVQPEVATPESGEPRRAPWLNKYRGRSN